jgi:DNA-binding LacI/PurR family transcriptional regulator
VVTGNGYVSDQTRQRVQEAIDLLDYRVNRAAQSLVSDRSTTIGLVVPTVSNPFFPEVFAGIQQTALEQNYTVSVFETGDRPELERRAISTLDEHRAAGIIVYIPNLPDEELRPLLQRHNAAVLIGHNALKDLAGIVRVDLHDAATQAVDYLVQVGRRNLAYLDAGPPDDKHVNQERIRGLRDAMQQNGLPVMPEYFVYSDGTMPGAQRATEALLSQWPDIDGLICHHDILAYGALEACDRLQIAVPEQVAVVGFDDISFSRLQRFSLTTLRFPKADIGKQAAQMLFRRIKGDLEPAEIVFKTQLIERGSTPQVGG